MVCVTARRGRGGAHAPRARKSSARSSTCGQAAFHWHVLDRGIEHVYIKPATPRLNGKVGRSHRIDAEGFYRLPGGVVVDDTKLFTAKLEAWERFYDFERPHGALGGQTPYERLRQKLGGPSVSGHLQLHS